MDDIIWLGEIQLQNDICLKKMKNFQNKTINFHFFSFIYRLWLGLPVSGVLRNIRQLFPVFFNLQSLLSRFRILVFRFLKICLAVPSGSRYYFMIDQYCAYRFRPSPEWEEVGVNLKSKKFLKKSMNWKILHVRDTDWSNRVGSDIDSEVKIFDIFWPSRQFRSPTTG